MQKREWVISLCLLCVLACVSAGITAFVLHQNQPDNIAAFENRFLNLLELDITSQENMEISVSQQEAAFAWPAGTQAMVASTAEQPLPSGCDDWQITLGGGGDPNGFQDQREGYQVWLRLCMIRDGEILGETWTEMPLLAERADRTRIYTVRAKAENADRWRLDVIITPMKDHLEAGTLTLKNWEVRAR